MNRRTERINELLRAEISDILMREMRDPRLDATMISVTAVETTQDLQHSKIYVSILGTDEERQGVMLRRGARRAVLHDRVHRHVPDLRQIPELAVKRDDSLERGDRLPRLLNDLAREREEGR